MKNPTVVDRDRVAKGLNDEWDALILLAAELPPESWAEPTDCPAWSVKDVYAHVIGTEATLLGRPNPDIEVPEALEHVRNDMARMNESWVLSYRDRSVTDVVSDLAEVVTERRAALAQQDQETFDEPSWTPAGEDTYGRFMRIRVFDMWFHEQDIREATKRPGGLEGAPVELVLDEVERVLGYVVGKRVGLPEGTSVRLDLTEPLEHVYEVDVTDRARVVENLESEPDVTLMLPGTVFLRLAGGRRSWDDPSIREQVAIEGNEELAHQVLGNLTFTM